MENQLDIYENIDNDVYEYPVSVTKPKKPTKPKEPNSNRATSADITNYSKALMTYAAQLSDYEDSMDLYSELAKSRRKDCIAIDEKFNEDIKEWTGLKDYPKAKEVLEYAIRENRGESKRNLIITVEEIMEFLIIPGA